jgi:transposase
LSSWAASSAADIDTGDPPKRRAEDEHHSNVTSIERARKKRQKRQRTGVRDLPEHLPRRTVVHTPQSGCDCEACGRGLREIGQDVSEVLDYEPGSFHVVRHVRPKLACAAAARSCRRQRRAAPSIAAWPAPACSRTCW